MAKFIIIVAVYRVLTPGVCVRVCVRARVCVSVNPPSAGPVYIRA